MNYFVHYPHQQHDPSSQIRESCDQSTNNFSYSNPYPNPQFSNSINQYSYYQNPIAQPSQPVEQEPNPPGVTPPLRPELVHNSFTQYHPHGAPAGIPTVGTQPLPVVHQPIVQPLYGGLRNMGGIVPRGESKIQLGLGPKLSVTGYPFHVGGPGRGHVLPMNVAIPFQDQTAIAHGGFHIQGGPSQLPSQSFGESHDGPRPKSSGRTYRVRGCGRGRGRGKGHALQKPTAAPAQDFERKLDILGGASQPMVESGASSSGQKLVPLQGPAQSSAVLPPPKAVTCELCKVECNTLEILQQHMNGKKHKKKLKVLEELQNLNQRVISVQTSTIELKSEEVIAQPDPLEVVPCQEMNEDTKVAGEKRKGEEVEPPQESGKKMRRGPSKRKLRGGKSNRKMRACDGAQPPKPKEVLPAPLICELCNVKCESVVVFQSHLAGKKHKSKAKRLSFG